MVELGIVDIREIIRLVKANFGIDLSNFAMTSLKYRLEHIISKNNLSSPENMYRKLTDDPSFFDTFLAQIFIPSSEMFRDPSVWRWLREELFAKLNEKALLNFKIWLPFCVSGGELYTLCIVLKELNLLDRVKIHATYFSDASLELIKRGDYPLKKTEISIENYKRFQGEEDFEKLIVREKYQIKRDSSLIEKVDFIKDDINFSRAPKNNKLILMRNSMIYFNPSFQESLLRTVHENLSPMGQLIIGLKEVLNKSKSNVIRFDEYEKNEGVFKKRIG